MLVPAIPGAILFSPLSLYLIYYLAQVKNIMFFHSKATVCGESSVSLLWRWYLHNLVTSAHLNQGQTFGKHSRAGYVCLTFHNSLGTNLSCLLSEPSGCD